MKKIIITILLTYLVSNQAIPQDLSGVGNTLSWISNMANQINNVLSTFKNSQRYINVAEEIQKVIQLSNQVNSKYRAVRNMSNYASEHNFVAFFNEGASEVDKHINASQDYVKLINQGVAIGEKLVSILQGSGSATDMVSSGADIAGMIGSGGLSGFGGIIGLGKQKEQPDPQKILDNLKSNDDMLDKSYRELKEATAILGKLNDELSTFENFDKHETVIKENSRFYVF